MTEKIRNYIFDFKNEVNELRRILGPRGDEIFFAEVGVDKRGDKPAEILQTVGDTRLEQRVYEYIKSYYKDDPGGTSFFHRIGKDGIYSDFVSIRKNEHLTEIFGEKNKDMLRLFFLYHETAHALIPGPAISNNYPFRECAADAYAALNLLQRFGRDAVPLLSMISWYRSYEAITHGTNHLSTTVLDRIIADSASRNFSRLTHAEIIKEATTYATDGTPTSEMLKEARHMFSRNRFNTITPDKAHLVMEASLSSTSQLGRYIGAKYFEPFTHPNTISFKGKSLRYAWKAQKNYRELIKNSVTTANMPDVARLLGPKAAPSRLRRLFNPRAKKSLGKFLQVTVPAGQKHFSFKS